MAIAADALEVPNLGASETTIRDHYDRDPAFYEAFLGPSVSYSTGFWHEPANRDTLEAAQDRKHDWHIEQAGLMDARRVLDVGCGWGSLTRRLMIRRPDIDYVGLTLSPVQRDYIHAYAPANMRAEVVAWQNYRGAHKFDAIIALESMEHFARNDADRAGRIEAYRLFFEFCARNLKPSGRLSLQVNGWRNVTPGGEAAAIRGSKIDQFWLEGNLAHASELMVAIEPGFNVVHFESEPRNYIYTLRAWIRNLERQRAALEPKMGAAMVDHYSASLRACLGAYLTGFATTHRLVAEPRRL